MNKSSRAKKERQKRLLEIIKEDPFMTDEDIAEYLDVSVPTVRLIGWNLVFPNFGREFVKWLLRITRK